MDTTLSVCAGRCLCARGKKGGKVGLNRFAREEGVLVRPEQEGLLGVALASYPST